MIRNLCGLLKSLLTIYISGPLTYVLNLSINSGIVPAQMKLARVVPLYKSGDKSLLSNYRPASVLPVFSKFLEKAVFYRLIRFFDKYEILNNDQYGFRKKHSTPLVLFYLHDKITSAIDERKHTVGIFLYLFKAFDTVNHRILLDKLKHFGIRGLALEWIKCYLYNRHQYVEFNGISSSFHEISCGVPQGSVLGPLFFLIYINDLYQISNIHDLVLFADDTNLFFSHFDSTTLMNLVNSEMLKLSDRFKANKLSIMYKSQIR